MNLCRVDCPYCGANIEADIENKKIIYCTYCGKQIELRENSKDVTINKNISINQNVNQRVINDAEILKEQNRHRENGWKLIIVSALITIIIAGLLFFNVRTKTNNVSNTDSLVREENNNTIENGENTDVLYEEKEMQTADKKDGNQNESLSINNSDRKQIELVESGYSIGKSDSFVHVHYAVKLHNPNKEYAIRFPRIVITARDENGAILHTDDMVLNSIAAEDTILYGNTDLYEGKIPDSVEIEVGENDDYDFVLQSGTDIIRQDQLLISNTSINNGSYKSTITGEVTNKSAQDLNSAAIIVILKKEDRMIGGAVEYVDGLKSGKTMPFEVKDHYDIDFDSFEVYGMQW